MFLLDIINTMMNLKQFGHLVLICVETNHDERIRYQIIMSLRDSNLSERLQTDPELNLNKAITMAR